MSNDVVIYGSGGHAKVVIDIIEQQGAFRIIGLLDDNEARHGVMFCGYHVLGGLAKAAESFGAKGEGKAIIAIGDNAIRLRVGELLEKTGIVPVTAIHPRAIVARDVEIQTGTVVMAGAIINPGARIGSHCIVNTGAIIDHDCRIGSGAHVAPGAVLCGNVSVGNGALIGVGARVIPGVVIGREVTVGAGAAVLRDIPDNDVVAGVPARSIRMAGR